MVASETCGANQRRNGPIKREVWSADRRSVDPAKIRIIQAIAGSQYFRNLPTKNETTTEALVLISDVPLPKLTQPLVFEPIFMERVWGGRRLGSLYGKPLPHAALIGESWEIVDRPEAQSVVHEGPLRGRTLHELWSKHRAEIFGKVPESARFPILCKLLDAQENLSLQVHPPRGIAKKLGGESKSELWYVANAAPKARIYAGFKKGTTRELFLKALEQGKVEKHLHAIEVKTGDAIFLPSGRMHALGAGNVLVEIQENSDTTYRIYDWDRTKKGRAARQMHVGEAMQCVDFKDVEPALLETKAQSLVKHELFEIEKWNLDKDREIAKTGRFAIVVCLTGAIDCAGRQFKPGDFFIITAQQSDRLLRAIEAETSLLRVTLPAAA